MDHAGRADHDFAGSHYTVTASPALPKPAQDPHPPIIIGGQGVQTDPALAAKYAAEFNVPFSPLDTVTTQYQRVRDAVVAANRPADSMTYSACFVGYCAGRDENEIVRRAAAIGREVDELRSNSPLVGTPGEIVDKLAPFAEAGVTRVYLQLLDPGRPGSSGPVRRRRRPSALIETRVRIGTRAAQRKPDDDFYGEPTQYAGYGEPTQSADYSSGRAYSEYPDHSPATGQTPYPTGPTPYPDQPRPTRGTANRPA